VDVADPRDQDFANPPVGRRRELAAVATHVSRPKAVPYALDVESPSSDDEHDLVDLSGPP